jgi:hypothetical protein
MAKAKARETQSDPIMVQNLNTACLNTPGIVGHEVRAKSPREAFIDAAVRDETGNTSHVTIHYKTKVGFNPQTYAALVLWLRWRVEAELKRCAEVTQ